MIQPACGSNFFFFHLIMKRLHSPVIVGGEAFYLAVRMEIVSESSSLALWPFIDFIQPTETADH